MSIIQEALRRQEEEQANENTLPDFPLLRDGRDEPPPPPKSPRKKRRWLGVLIALLIMLASVAGLFILYQVGLMPFLNDQDGISPIAAAPEQTAAPVAEGGQPTQSKPGELVAKAKDSLDAARKQVEDANAVSPDDSEQEEDKVEKIVAMPVAKPGELEQGADSAQAAEEAVKDASGQAAAPAAEEQKPEEPATVPAPAKEQVEPVIWPQVQIKGIMAPGGGNSGAVLLDSSMFSEGDSYKGVRILKISRTNVLLEFQGEKRLVSTGQSVGN
jgi:hypothetical protein